MSTKITALPSFDMYLVNTLGSPRVLAFNADRLSEAFEKDSTPAMGSVCALLGYLNEDEETEVLFGFAITRSRSGIAARTLRATLSPIFVLKRPGFVGGSRVMEREWIHAPTQKQGTPLLR